MHLGAFLGTAGEHSLQFVSEQPPALWGSIDSAQQFGILSMFSPKISGSLWTPTFEAPHSSY